MVGRNQCGRICRTENKSKGRAVVVGVKLLQRLLTRVTSTCWFVAVGDVFKIARFVPIDHLFYDDTDGTVRSTLLHINTLQEK